MRRAFELLAAAVAVAALLLVAYFGYASAQMSRRINLSSGQGFLTAVGTTVTTTTTRPAGFDLVDAAGRSAAQVLKKGGLLTGVPFRLRDAQSGEYLVAVAGSDGKCGLGLAPAGTSWYFQKVASVFTKTRPAPVLFEKKYVLSPVGPGACSGGYALVAGAGAAFSYTVDAATAAAAAWAVERA